jgi:hypothetical protein
MSDQVPEPITLDVHDSTLGTTTTTTEEPDNG